MTYLKTTMEMNVPETEDVMERYGGCLLCGGCLDLLIKDAYDTRFGIKKNYDLAICKACSTIQLSFPPLSEQLNILYEKYYNFEGLRQESYSRIRSGFLQSLQKKLERDFFIETICLTPFPHLPWYFNSQIFWKALPKNSEDKKRY